MQVTLIDPSPNPGGVCLYRGCIPSKALLHVADVLNEAKHADAWGISFGAPTIDLDRLRAFKTKVVTQLTGGLGQLSKQRKITYVQGTARFTDAKTLEIPAEGGETQTLSFEHAIIATGSHPAKVPGLSLDSPRLMDSTSALDLPDIPKTAARRRRRLHRARAGQRLRGARHQGHRRRNDRRAAARRRPRPGERAGQADRVDLRSGASSTPRSSGMKEQKNGHRRVDLPRRTGRKAGEEGADASTACSSRSAVGPIPVAGIDNTGVVVNQRGFVEVNAVAPDRRADHLRDRRRRR